MYTYYVVRSDTYLCREYMCFCLHVYAHVYNDIPNKVLYKIHYTPGLCNVLYVLYIKCTYMYICIHAHVH